MTKILINEQYDVEDPGVKKAFGKGDKRTDYADAWKETGNVILLGLAGSGKNRLAELLSEKTGGAVVTPKTAEQALSALNETNQIIVLSDSLVEDTAVQPLIHGAGKAFYLMVNTNLLAERLAERDGCEDKDALWRDLSARLAAMEPVFYSTLHFILQAAMEPEELVDDAMEKIAF